MDFSGPTLFAGLLVSAVGAGMFVYGRKQQRAPHMVTGIILCVYPAFVSGALAILAIGAAVIGLLWLVVRLGA